MEACHLNIAVHYYNIIIIIIIIIITFMHCIYNYVSGTNHVPRACSSVAIL